MTATTLRGVLPVAAPTSCFDPGRAHGIPRSRQAASNWSTREDGASLARTRNFAFPAWTAACAATRPEASVFARCASPSTAIQRGGADLGPDETGPVDARRTSASWS